MGISKMRSSGVQEFRSSGVQEFRSSGVQEFRSSMSIYAFIRMQMVLGFIPGPKKDVAKQGIAYI
jgi:hypothetical protein